MAMTVRPLTRDDLELLAEWLSRPHVERWWREASDEASVEAAYGPMIDGTDPTEGFIALSDGQPIGFIQRYLFDDNPQWQQTVAAGVGVLPALGIDYLIGDEAMTGRGYGPEMISTVVADSWATYPDIPAVVVDVLQENRASWRALERAGFHRVWAGILESDDPSDQGPCYLYLQSRPRPEPRQATVSGSVRLSQARPNRDDRPGGGPHRRRGR
jgi:aminoglycoside 6'-N-acetyltransferase